MVPALKDLARFEAIENYGILDTPREDDYDEIVRLAAQICDAPISAITFLAEEKQWFKAEVGLGIRETSLDVSWRVGRLVLGGDEALGLRFTPCVQT